MYLPEQFREERPEELHPFLRAHPLGLLVTLANGRSEADLIPMSLVTPSPERTLLRGHVARANPVVAAVPSGTEVLVVFKGADHYVTPSWYPSKQRDGRVVPTWNYSVVHVRGRLTWFTEPAALRTLVAALTDEHERDRPAPWAVSDAPDDYIEGMLRAIVGFEIDVTEMIGKFKNSQNRNDEDRAGVAAGLATALVRAPRAR